MSKRKTTSQNEPEPMAAPLPVWVPNAAQKEAIRLAEHFDIIFLVGKAGTGKTGVATYLATKARRAYITRPAIEITGEKLGYLKGGPDEKLHPFMLPIMDSLEDIVGEKEAPKQFKKFHIAPLAFIRGRTFKNCVSILDEAQNATPDQRFAYLTRLGKVGKMIISGDPQQSDIPGSGEAFIEEAEALAATGAAAIVWFLDEGLNQRSKHLEAIQSVYAKLRKERQNRRGR